MYIRLNILQAYFTSKRDSAFGAEILDGGHSKVKVVFVEGCDLVKVNVAAKVKLLLGDDDSEDQIEQEEKTDKEESKKEPLDKRPLAL